MTRPRRVLVVTTNLSGPGGSADGAAGNSWRLILEALGHQVRGTILAPRVAGAPDREQLGGLDLRRVGPRRPVISLADAASRGAMLRVAGLTAALWRSATAEIRSGTYDIVHALWAVPAGLACTWPRPDLPVLLSCPGSDLHTWSPRRLAGLPFRSAVRRADVVAPTGISACDLARSAGARDVRPIPICFDPAIFQTTVCRPAAHIVASVGRLTQAKGALVLADAFARVASRDPHAQLVVCGDGPARPEFEALVDRAGISSRVKVLGSVDPVKVAGVLSRSRMLAIGSRGEGMPAAAVEALATGRPVVTTDCGDHTRLVRAGGGRVVGIDDVAGLAGAIEAEFHTRRDPLVLRRLVEPYRPGRVADTILRTYEELVVERAA